ncbi:MAG TPA: Gfo/Idh/MocA family oxidoreductase [Chloroflexota bacterium]|nr:Gfo/Idh/MocA family oxidoreductase [Chloroflexota bacterium]
MSIIRMAQFGVGHGHAAGKAAAMRANPAVDFAGVFEPDPAAREAAAGHRAYAGARWFRSEDELLGDPTIQALAIEGLNAESLPMALAGARAGKHLWYDKPAGDDWSLYQQLVAAVRANRVYLQMGYMFRYQDGFQRLAEWVRGGLLGDVFSVRAHMSTWIPEAGGAFTRGTIAASHDAGILYDLSGHMLDQLLWLLADERPHRIASFLRNDATAGIPRFKDNTLGVYEFARAIAMIDIAAMEHQPTARRFEVYGTRGSVILDPMEPATGARLVLDAARGGFQKGLQVVPLAGTTRQRSYELELEAFMPIALGERPPDRPLEHEILVQETLLRATGSIRSEEGDRTTP